MRKVTRTSARDDDDATVAISMYKAVNKAAPSKADNEYFRFGDKGTVCSYPPRTTSPRDPPCLSSASPPSRLDGGFSSFGDAAPAVDRVHGLYLYGGLYLYCAPHPLLRRHVVALPVQMFGQKWSETPIKGGGAHRCKGLVL